jgi:protein MBA1
MGGVQHVRPKVPSAQGMRSRVKDMSMSDLPMDLGLLPGTFIRPMWRNLPSIFSHPKERLRMEWIWLKMAVQNFIGWVSRANFPLLQCSFIESLVAESTSCGCCGRIFVMANHSSRTTRIVAYAKFINKKMPLRLRDRKRAALDLHKRMYNAFAE